MSAISDKVLRALASVEPRDSATFSPTQGASMERRLAEVAKVALDAREALRGLMENLCAGEFPDTWPHADRARAAAWRCLGDEAKAAAAEQSAKDHEALGTFASRQALLPKPAGEG